MSLFVAETLDLSTLPPFTLANVDYETERSNLITGIKARLTAAGIAYDVDGLETDPFVMLAEEFAYRKILDLQALNDAGKRLTLAYGYGAALDHIAATYYADVGVTRAVLVPASGSAPAVLESDNAFRKRVQLAPATRTPGTLQGYEYFALTAAPFLIDAKAFNYASGLCSQGQILVVVLGKDPNPDQSLDVPAQDEAAQLVLAQKFLLNRNTKQGSDVVMVRAARRVNATVSAVLGVPSGPDPSLVVAAAKASLQAYVNECQSSIGRIFARSGQDAALSVGGVHRVRLSSSQNDVDPGPDGVVSVTIGAITTEAINV